MFQKSAIGCKSFSHGVIEIRTDEAYRFSSMARSRNSYRYAAFNALTRYESQVAGREFVSPTLQPNRIGWRIMHLGDFVGNGRTGRSAMAPGLFTSGPSWAGCWRARLPAAAASWVKIVSEERGRSVPQQGFLLFY
jgi:hypothetical protein